MKKSKLAVVYTERYLDHETGDHVENPRRAEAIMDALRDSDWRDRLSLITPRAAQPSEIELIHSREHIVNIKRACGLARGLSYINPDTAVCSVSYEVALLAAGGVLAGIETVLSGGAENFFAVVRPPGHHAEYDESLGFCLFNNIAIGAKYALEHLGLERIFILDWDVHHGNGTQHSFENDRRVFFCSFHQYPHYPGTGSATEWGRGDGLGYTLNLPMRAGASNDDYMYLMEEVVGLALLHFMPQMVLVSAGFDAHAEDPLSGINLTEEGFSAMVEFIQNIMGPDIPIGMVLEGGYNLSSLARSAAAAAGVLTGEASAYVSLSKSPSRMAVNLDHKQLEEHPFLLKRREPALPAIPLPEHGDEIRTHVEKIEEFK